MAAKTPSARPPRAIFEYRIDMTENEKVALLTEVPNVESCYGYNALLYIFGSKAAVIAANKGATEYNLRKRQAPRGLSSNLPIYSARGP